MQRTFPGNLARVIVGAQKKLAPAYKLMNGRRKSGREEARFGMLGLHGRVVWEFRRGIFSGFSP